MSPIAETGKTARSIVGALKDQPLLLSLVLLNMAMIAFMFYYIHNTFATRTSNLGQLFSVQEKIFAQWSEMLKHQQALADKLEKCIPIDEVAKLVESLRNVAKP